LIYNLIKTPPIFHWVLGAPTSYRDRSHCRPIQSTKLNI